MKQTRIKEIEYHMSMIMNILGIEETESTKDTPRRVAKMYVNEVFSSINNEGYSELTKQMTCFPNDGMEELIIVKDIDFSSMCEHHLMPFTGKIAVGYIPDKSIIGLSKIPRVVKYFSKKPQLQERLTREIGEYLQFIIKGKGIIVYCYDSNHTCVSVRGAESCCNTDTVYSKNIDADTKREFFARLGVM